MDGTRVPWTGTTHVVRDPCVGIPLSRSHRGASPGGAVVCAFIIFGIAQAMRMHAIGAVGFIIKMNEDGISHFRPNDRSENP